MKEDQVDTKIAFEGLHIETFYLRGMFFRLMELAKTTYKAWQAHKTYKTHETKCLAKVIKAVNNC